jgi:hypothetical protein
MAARNDITGDSITSKTTSEKYRDNWDAIFAKKEKKEEDKDLKFMTAEQYMEGIEKEDE